MPQNTWTREQLLAAYSLYCQLPFGKLHSRTPEIVAMAAHIARTPSALAMKLSNIASLDPEITSTGRRGLTGASSADRRMWEEMQNDWTAFSSAIDEALSKFGIKSSETETEEQDDIARQIEYTGYDRDAFVKVRKGQAFFRKAVLSAYDQRCCVTGLSIPRLLVASHIKPWRSDPENRLNPRNGLCLNVLHDKAFDIGIITITERMTVKVTTRLDDRTEFFASTLRSLEGKAILLPDKFKPDDRFLAYHRDRVFLS